MVPIRAYLKGFKSYSVEQQFLFDGAPLWMLSGPNGHGKSTVLDAMTFALYGTHRGSSHNVKDLISHGVDALVVEVDFAVGQDVYRAKRTLNRTGRSTRQALHVQGPN